MNPFGPQNGNASSSLPSGNTKTRYGTNDTWVKDASASGTNDGTILDAGFFNNIIGNLYGIIQGAGIAVPSRGDMTGLFRAIQSICSGFITALAPSATIDTTNASNISHGTLPAARLPAPGPAALGGVKSIAASPSQFLTSIGGDGTPHQAQPAASDISGLAPSATVDTTNANNITGGTLAIARLPASVVGGLNYQGTWNASTNSPALSSGVGTKGFMYKVSVAGTTTLDGISSWSVGDNVVFDGTTWDKIDGNTNEVLSVSGRTGAVVLSSTDLSDGNTGTGAVVHASGATLTNPIVGTQSVGDNSTKAASTAYADRAAAPTVGSRNRIINGGMVVDQRNAGASQTITGSLAYTVDRFYAFTTGANCTGQQVAGTLPGSLNSYQFTGAASVTAISFGQRIERQDSFDLAGSTATLSVNLSNSLLTTVTWAAYYANSNDTFGATTSIASGSFTVNSTLTRYSTNIAIPSAATTGIEIRFSVGAQTSGTWVIDSVQLEPGSVATAFERRKISYELAACQRYAEWIPYNAWFGSNAAGGSIVWSAPFKVDKRITPTIGSLSTEPAQSQSTANNSSQTMGAINTRSAIGTLVAVASGVCNVTGYRFFASCEL